MNYLKSSLIGFATTAALLAGTGIASAQVISGGNMTAYGNASNAVIVPMAGSGTLTAIGTASSPVTYIGPAGTVAASPYVPANYAAGYYGNLATSNYTYPGVPNTGGSSMNGSTAASTNLNNTGTYLPPSYINSLGGVTGGISVPAGYTVAFGPYGNLVSTVNANSTVSSGFPGAPNTGGPITASGGFVTNGTMNTNGFTGFVNGVNGNFLNSNGAVVTMGANGLIRITGIVSTVTPNALGVNSGNQTWTIRWNGATTISSTSGINSVTGSQISAGDMIEVEGYLDQTFVSQIDATSIRDISLH